MPEIKEQIYDLRSKGYGAKKISKELGVSLNTVKSILRRVASENTEAALCKNCGIGIENSSSHKKVFCCDKCRNEWWNKRRKNIEKASDKKRVCACCGKEFVSYSHKDQRYCSHECYIRARYKSKAAEDGQR